jgi:hypothetical protein
VSLFDDLYNDALGQQGNAAVNRQAIAQPLPKPEEDSALSKLAGVPLSGMAWLGETLGKPGRMVRGLLGGNPRELLNAVPFSDSLGITDPTKQTSGEDLAKQFGLLEGEGTKGEFELRDPRRTRH